MYMDGIRGVHHQRYTLFTKRGFPRPLVLPRWLGRVDGVDGWTLLAADQR